MTDPLPLDSPRWGTFGVQIGERAELPRLLRSLSDEPQVRVIGKPVFTQLSAMLFQDFECADAAVPALPHLVALTGRAEGAELGELLTLIGFLAGGLEDPTRPPDLRPALDAALRACEPVAIQYFLATDLTLIQAYYAGLACIALTRNPLGRLVQDNYIPYSIASTRAVCPNWDLEFELAAYDTGLVVPRPGAAWPAPDPPVPLSPPPPPASGERDPNPWAPVAAAIRDLMATKPPPPELLPHFQAALALADGGLTPQANPSATFSLVGVLLAIKGFAGPAHRYYHASDQIACPGCKARFRFADHWWRLNL